MSERHVDDLLRQANPVTETTEIDPALLARVVAQTEEVLRMDTPGSRMPRRRVIAVASGVAVAAVAAVAIAAVALRGDDAPAPPGGVALAGGGAMTSCIAFSEEQLARAPIAFDGTVTSIDGGDVTLDVERWYRGGEGDSVTVHAPDLAHAEALVGAVGFEEGRRYLISADDVSGQIVPAVCGFSVTYSDELAATFERAFKS